METTHGLSPPLFVWYAASLPRCPAILELGAYLSPSWTKGTCRIQRERAGITAWSELRIVKGRRKWKTIITRHTLMEPIQSAG